LKTTVSFVIAAIAALWAFSDSLPFQNEVTVYKMFCTGGLKEGKCNSKEQTANPTTFKVLVDQQTVLYWHGGNDAPKRLVHCAVRNTQNWSCQLGNRLEDDPKYQWEMVDGRYRDVVQKPALSSQELFYQVPKWYWWWVRFSQDR